MGTNSRSVKGLLVVTSLLEGTTGIALMVAPSLVVKMLLGSPILDPITLILSRIAGAALVSLAISCWYARNDESAYPLIIGLLFYNLASIVFLGIAGILDDMNGILLWPAIGEHILMSGWCAVVHYAKVNSPTEEKYRSN